MKVFKSSSTLALCCAMSSGISSRGSVTAFVAPSTTTKIAAASSSSIQNMQSSDSDNDMSGGPLVQESRRTVLGRAAGGFAAMSLSLLSVPTPGIAASAPAKVRIFETTVNSINT